jgi:DNA repair photolyase
MKLAAESVLGDDGQLEHDYRLQNGSDEVVKKYNGTPTLDRLRRDSREHGDPTERLDILESPILCSECGGAVEDRFSADPQRNILCWTCANKSESEERNGVSRAVDPTKAILSQSQLYHKSLCDYVINVATGCSHGCKFCYVPDTPNIRTRQDMLQEKTGIDDGQKDWGGYLLYRDDLPERLARKLEGKQEWKKTKRGRGVVMLSSGTDCYQDRRTAQITRGCVAELVKDGRDVRILTRSPAVTRDIDLFNESDGLVTVGSSIPCLDDERVRAIETSAPPPSKRLEALQELASHGIRTYVSMSPTYPTQSKGDLRQLMSKFAELETLETVFHEPINPRGENFQMTIKAARQAGDDELAKELKKIAEDKGKWITYSLDHLTWVRDIGDDIGINVHLWPDRGVINELERKGFDDPAEWLSDWRTRVSDEEFNSDGAQVEAG